MAPAVVLSPLAVRPPITRGIVISRQMYYLNNVAGACREPFDVTACGSLIPCITAVNRLFEISVQNMSVSSEYVCNM